MTIVVGKEVDLANPRQHFMDFNAIYMLECEIGLKPFEFFSSAELAIDSVPNLKKYFKQESSRPTGWIKDFSFFRL